MAGEKSFVHNVQILVGILQLWDYFYDNLPDFKDSMVVVAMNEVNHCEICMTDRVGFPKVVVYIDDKAVDDDFFVEKEDLEYGMRYYFSEYLMNPNAEAEYGDVDPKEDVMEVSVEDFEEIQNAIDTREDDLFSAFLTFMDTVCDRDPCVLYDDENSEVLQESFEEILRVLGEDFSWPVHRPNLFENDKGELDFSLYPYDKDGTWE